MPLHAHSKSIIYIVKLTRRECATELEEKTMLYILIILLIILWGFSWLSLGKDFFQPSCLVNLSFLATVFCALLMKSQWRYEYHLVTIWIIFLGLISIYIANLFFYKYQNVFKKNRVQQTEALTVTKVSVVLCALMVGVQIVGIVLYGWEILRIAGGGNSISAIMSAFRNSVSYGTEQSVSFVATQFLNVSFVICLVSLYILIKNALLQGLKGSIRFLLPIVLYVFGSLMTGGRFGTLIIITAGITMYAVLYHRVFSRRFTWKIRFKIALFVILALVAFYFVRELIGRTSVSSQNQNFVEYIGTYVGGALPLFDMYLQDPVASSAIIGKETFYAINSQLIEWGLIDVEQYLTHLEFRSINGYSLGNVYTGFRRNIQDFGILGMFILQFVFSSIMSGFYNKIKRNSSEYSIILYCSIAYVLFLHGVNDNFYTRVISFGELVIIILLYLAYSCLIRKRFGRLNLSWKTTRE